MNLVLPWENRVQIEEIVQKAVSNTKIIDKMFTECSKSSQIVFFYKVFY